MYACSVAQSCLTVTPWTVARQAPLSMEFSGQEYRSGLPFLTPGDLPDPGIKPRCPTLQVDCHVISCSIQNFKNYIYFLNKMAIVTKILF